MKRNSARARGELPLVNLWLGLIIDWIFSPYPDDMPPSSLVHLSSLSMLLFPFAAGPSLHRESAAASFLADSLSPPDFFFFPPPLPSELAPSASRASPRPPFLLARLTKMGLAASGSRFPRKLSSYKINYPPYFIAPRRALSQGARRRERAGSLVLFLPLPVPAAPGRVSDELDSLKDRNEDIGAIVIARPFPRAAAVRETIRAGKECRKIEKTERDPLSRITNERETKMGGSFRTMTLLISALRKVLVLSNLDSQRISLE